MIEEIENIELPMIEKYTKELAEELKNTIFSFIIKNKGDKDIFYERYYEIISCSLCSILAVHLKQINKEEREEILSNFKEIIFSLIDKMEE